jgi:hypothetical protein
MTKVPSNVRLYGILPSDGLHDAVEASWAW